jgi:hypothetical protein
MDIVFLITTYNRQESCQKLVDSLQGLGDIVVVNDGCDYTISGCQQIFLSSHMGKTGYFMVVNILWRNRGQHKYYIMLPDDFMPHPDIISESLRLWAEIQDPQKICLNLFTDRIGVPCWTRFMPVDKGNVWQTGWVDMCFICEDKFFQIVPRIDLPIRHRYRSSGVGCFISTKLFKHGYHMYQVKESLVIIQEAHCTSKMHDISQTDSYDRLHNGRHRLRTSTKGEFTQDTRKSRRTGR